MMKCERDFFKPFRIPEQFKVNTKAQMLNIFDAQEADSCVVVKEGYEQYFYDGREWVTFTEMGKRIEKALAGANR